MVNQRRRSHDTDVTRAAERLGCSPGTIYQRLRLGWSRKRALSTPVARSNPRRRASLLQQLRAAGVPKATYYERRGRGLSHAAALRTDEVIVW